MKDNSKKDDNVKNNHDDRVASRARRKKRGHDLRSKSLGLVGKINLESSSNNRKKILFGDNDHEEVVVEKEEIDSSKDSSKKNDDQNKSDSSDDDSSDDDSSDDDDQVEEVKGSTAKELALDQRQKERKTMEESKMDATRRKRKKQVEEEESDDDEEEMDDAFFETLDKDLDEERKKKIELEIKPEGKRTTFISEDEDRFSTNTTTEHNIKVVVLESTTVPEYNKPSKRAVFFGRDCLFDNGKPMVKRKKQKSKLITGQKGSKLKGWRRSAKMKRIIIGQNSRRKSMW